MLTLLTDFGLSDPYVGVMKGVIAQIAPEVQTIDLTHQIPAQNVAAARFCLMNAYPYFPRGTVHVAIVDPGVGSQRRSIALQLEDGFLIAPDNGIVSGVVSQFPIVGAIELNNPQYWRNSSPSATFHGRDIFAPVAAHLAKGVPFAELGAAIDPATLVQLPIAPPTMTDEGMTGFVQHIDHFGNVITNIPGSVVEGRLWYVQVGQHKITGCKTYSDGEIGALVALVGSHGWVELAVNGGNANETLQLTWTDPMQIKWS